MKTAKKVDTKKKYASIKDTFNGAEPKITVIESQGQMADVLNWYNYQFTAKDSGPWVIDFMKKYGFSQKEISIIKTLPEWKIGLTAGAMCRLVNKGVKIPQSNIDWVLSRINDNLRTVSLTKEPRNISIVRVKSADSKIGQYIADIEDAIDAFIDNNFNTIFKPYDYMKSKEIKFNHAQAIVSYYQRLKEELTLAMTGKDNQVREGYSHLSKVNLKKYLEFITLIISDAESIASAQRAVRTKKQPRAKTSTQLVSKLRYLKESSTYKLTSIDPAKIIKSRALIVFNTKSRKLGIYVANTDIGLSVKSSTIINYSEEYSISKTLRKPETVLGDLLNISKVQANKLFLDISTSPSFLNGRINEDTILLRVW